ncbi:MAG: aminoacyl-tRNA hydrolase [Anaerolineae bacterium]|nr:aminoacyl-tRNA hydrolase [Anaerolineae bacterium]
MSTPYLIVGLGNPGTKYQGTRHNIGFRCVEALAARHGLSFDKKQAKALVAKGAIQRKQVILAKPQTYMNLSGDSVSGLLNFYKIPPENLLVIFDDLDLPLGTLRIRASGGSGGQKGMKHIIQRIGTQDFNRIRFGIDRPPGRMDPAAYVLLPFPEGDAQILAEETIQRAITAIELWLNEDINSAMNAQNGSTEDVVQRQSSALEQQNSAHPDTGTRKPANGLPDRME